MSFPASNQTDFDFTRRLVQTPGAVPEDVTLQVLSPCRRDSILRSVQSLKGAKKAILFLYIATSDNFRDTILKTCDKHCLEQATHSTKYARSITKDDPLAQETEWTLGFGFEDFGNTRPEVAIGYSKAIMSTWGATEEKPMIQGFATSVEVTTPNVFADQIEHFLNNISDRKRLILSIHPHNDRGCAVAATELGYLAGADRLEGCLFGNGERAGNVDLVTLGLNLLTQGIDPGIDFSDLPSVCATVKEISPICVHPRAPYAGEYYFRAFSGGHQNAIIKGLKIRNRENQDRKERMGELSGEVIWRIPYLPMDPTDIGFQMNSIFGVNSQSGGSGVGWQIQSQLELILPRGLEIAFSKVVKAKSEHVGRELSTDELCHLFIEYYSIVEFESLIQITLTPKESRNVNSHIVLDLNKGERCPEFPQKDLLLAISALSARLNIEIIKVDPTEQKDIKNGSIVTYAECRTSEHEDDLWGVAMHHDCKSSKNSNFVSFVCEWSFH